MVKVMIVDDHTLMRRIVREVIEKESDLEVVAEATDGFEAESQAAQIQPEVVLMDLDMPGCDGLEGTERVLACSPNSCVVIFTASHQERHIFQALQCGAIGYVTKDVEPDALVQAIRCAARNELYIPGALALPVVARLRTLGPDKRHDLRARGTGVHPANGGYAESTHADNARSLSALPAPSSAPLAYRIPRRRSASQKTTSTQSPEGQMPEAKDNTRPLTERELEILAFMRKGRKNREIAEMLCIAESTVHKHVQNIFEKLHARNRTEAIYLTSTM